MITPLFRPALLTMKGSLKSQIMMAIICTRDLGVSLFSTDEIGRHTDPRTDSGTDPAKEVSGELAPLVKNSFWGVLHPSRVHLQG